MSNIFVISGPSGSGKNTVYEGLLKKNPKIAQTVSVTTRQPREGETNGIDYYFVNTDEFEKRINNDSFIEYVKYGNNYYGTLKSEVKRLADEGKTVVLIIDVTGALNFKKVFPDSVSIFLLPPSEEELRRRLCKRGTDSDEAINSRLAIAMDELKQASKYDYRVTNAELDVCVEEVYTIMKKEQGVL